MGSIVFSSSQNEPYREIKDTHDERGVDAAEKETVWGVHRYSPPAAASGRATTPASAERWSAVEKLRNASRSVF